jgi:alkylation response protein AidB-like acyl-CoA dehydrogenase
MFLAPDQDEQSIADAARAFLAATIPLARLHHGGAPDLTPAQRTGLGEMGWFALTLAEADGGSGLSPVEHALFFCEVGRCAGPLDILTLCLAGMLAREHPDLASKFLSGAIGAALMVSDTSGDLLLGDAHADLAVRVDAAGAGLVELVSGDGSETPSLDPAVSIRRLTQSGAVRAAADGPHIWRMGVIGAAAMLVGVAEQSLALIVDYAKVRETFGRAIGSYQAVRHPCADMAVRLEAARCQLWYAATALKESRADVDTHILAAKHLANEAALANADACIQLHGGIGVADEHDAHLLLKHALMLSRVFGGKRALLRELLEATTEA